MTDWDDVLECLQRTVQAITGARESTPESESRTGNETVDAFREQMEILHRDLQALKQILDHADAYAEEQLAAALSHLRTGKKSEYHRVPRVSQEHPKN